MLIRTAIALLAATPAWAQPAPVRLTYQAYAHGFSVVAVQASVDVSAAAYRVAISYRLTGVVGTLLHGDATTTVDGRFAGATAVPRQFFSTGHFRGQPRVTQIDWRDGRPLLTQIVPAADSERDPVPLEEQANTIDSISAMAVLLHDIAATGRCDGVSRTFDGRRLSTITAHTVGEETLEQTGRSSFQGAALRCDFDGRQIGGFLRDADQAVLRRPQHGSAWFARLAPGEPPVPVRITFETPTFGEATMYLTARG